MLQLLQKKLGAHTAFIGKAGKDMHGEFLKSVLEKEKVDTKGMLLDENYFTTLAFVSVAKMESVLSLLRENREQIPKLRKKR